MANRAGPVARPHVLIAGAGVAGLEALLALRVLSGDLLDVELLAPEERFTYRPVTVAEPFDRGEAQRFDIDEIAQDQRARHTQGTLERVDPGAQLVHTVEGNALAYDHLLLACGARPLEAIPGALTFRGAQDVRALRALLDGVEQGSVRSVAFALPPGSSWPLPLYELALMTAAHATAHGLDHVAITLVTHEPKPLEMFGGEVSARLAELLSAGGIEVWTATRPRSFHDGLLMLEEGEHLRVDSVVALPQLTGPWIEGLPRDAWGFVPTDAHGRVAGAAEVYAAGDATAFPLKQGGLAAQQADSAARAIAAAAGADVEQRAFQPVLRGLLLTGGEPLYLRAEPNRGAPPDSDALDPSLQSAPPPPAGTWRSSATAHALWWPPSKVAGRYLAPYLAEARPVPLGSGPLHDRGGGEQGGDHEAGMELALVLADADAEWGDYASALRTLHTAEALGGGRLPDTYQAKRRHWERALGEAS
jgi:sulfide:quinone oxidoreductase